MSKERQNKIVAQNRKALFDYEIEESFEAGISLFGSEVKSLRHGGGNISEGYVGMNATMGVIISNFNISIYRHSPPNQQHDPKRIKHLLMHKAQIVKITTKAQKKGFTIIPLSVYFNKQNRVKVQIALARGKKLFDKRQVIKERDISREVRREAKGEF